MKKITLLFVALYTYLNVYAQQFEAITEEGVSVTYYVMNSTSVYVGNYVTGTGWTKCISDSTEGVVTIPPEVTNDGKTYNVLGIKNKAFYECRKITQINLPDCITKIGERAFQRCSGLTSFNIPNSVTSISYCAFSGCQLLKEIIIPDAVTTIGDDAFSSCASLTSVTIGSGVKSIGNYCFWYSRLKSVTIGSGVESIGNYCFSDCVSLKTITFQKNSNKTSIGDYAFKNCSSIDTLYIPANVTSLGNDVFDGCAFKKLIVEDSPYVLGVGYCKSYDSVQYNVVNIGIFSNIASPNLEEAYIGRHISTRDDANYIHTAFSGCNTITSVEFGSNVDYVGTNMFNGCKKLSKVVLKSKEKVIIASNAFKNIASDATLYVQFGKAPYYGGWSNIVESDAEIGDTFQAFIDSSDGAVKAVFSISRLNPNEVSFNSISNTIVGEMNIPSIIEYKEISFKVTGIDASAFKNSTGMTSLSIPQDIVRIWNAFEGCTSLKSVYVRWQTPDGVFVDDGNFNDIPDDAVLYVPKGSKALYESIDVWKKFSEINVVADPLSLGEIVTNSGSQVYLPIILNHKEAISGLTFKLTLPEDISIVEENGSLSVLPTDKTESMTVMCNKDPEEDNSYLFVMFSLNGDPINSDDCTLMNVKLATASDILKGNYYISLEDVTLATSTYNTLLLAETKSQLSIIDKVNNIYFNDSKVKEICLANWDLNGDGELDTDEAATVRDLGEVFNENAEITSFDELQYFTGLTTIGGQAFNACNSLISVHIPSSVNEIENGAFTGCGELNFIVVDKNNKYYDSRNNCNALIKSSENKLILGCFNSIIPKNVEIIGSQAFKNCLGLTSLNISSSVSVIESDAFYGCSNLTSMDIPNSVTSIGPSAFSGCSSLTTVNMPIHITSIAEGTFYGCSALTALDIPDNVTGIGANAFSGCSSLELINIPDNLTSIGEEAFNECANLATLDIPNCLTSLGANAFSGCSSLDTLVIPQSLVAIGEGAFYDCHSLNTITVDENNTSYDSRDNCNAIIETATNRLMFGSNNTVIPNSITAIGNGAFRNIKGLTSLVLPENLTSIGEHAFDGCSNLKLVKLKNAIPVDIDENVFSNRSKAKLYVPMAGLDDYMAFNYWNEFKIIKGYPDGDVNQDGVIDVVDVVDIARFVVSTSRDVFDEYLADLNYDELVNIADAVTLVNVIAGDVNFTSRRATMMPNDVLTLNKNMDHSLSLVLEGDGQYTAFQFDLTLPNDLVVMNMTLNSQRKQKHQLLYNKVSDGKYRVAALSTSNRVFLGTAGELINIAIDGRVTCDIMVDNIHFVTVQGNDMPFNAVYLIGSSTTSIDAVEDESVKKNQQIYNLNGQRIAAPQKGINIVGGKKVIMK